MEAEFIRLVRRRTGITQTGLAAWLDVDQGTVSRWERGVSRPRPSTLAAMRTLLIQDEERRVRDRSIAMVRNNLLPATLMGPGLHLKEFSSFAVAHYNQRSGTDLRRLVGSSLETQASRSGYPQLWDCVLRSGLLEGEAIIFTFAINSRGKGHVTVCEPFFEDGAIAGFLNYVTRYFDFPENKERTLEFAQFVPASDPTQNRVLYRGQRAEFCEQSLMLC
ncbi:helix-turn-helix domain-containing protein [Aestuariivita boseongensis]|uniref:helix-turn-helix domain-containing protein n=1 Tax=Aestuariivita boseongensis TaxID=1470562 RepID=UPI00068050FF|nr:helix-turn-helix transcriptional regulator [Aestuariivita boseongensis]